jgi:hypothetical protein
LRRRDKPGPHGIVHHVPNDIVCILVAAKGSIEEALLPQLHSIATLEMKPGRLFGEVNEREQIGILRESGHETVKVIGHEAVRRKFKLLQRTRLQNLPENLMDDGPIGEEPFAILRAECQEDPLRPDVGLRGETEWMRSHEPRTWQSTCQMFPRLVPRV